MSLIKIYEENPQPQMIKKVVEVLRNGGLVIYPTDTVYGLGCDITKPKAIEAICKIKNIKPEKANFSIICHDLSHITDYTKSFDTQVFRIMKKALHGPYTFILQASNTLPKLLQNNRKTVGIRVPNNNIARTIVKELGNPIITTSIKDEDEIIEYSTNPELIYERFASLVDIVIDGGIGNIFPSTVIDFSNGEVEVIREGAGDLSVL